MRRSHSLLLCLLLSCVLPAIAQASRPGPPGMGTFQVTGTVTDKAVDHYPGFAGDCPDTPTVELWISYEGNTAPLFCLNRLACRCKEVAVGSLISARGRLLGSRVNAGDPVNEDWIVVLELEDLTVLQSSSEGEPTPAAVAYIQESR